MKQLTQTEMLRIVFDNPKMRDEYYKRLSEGEFRDISGIGVTKKLSIRGKKVGIQRYNNSTKAIASGVYYDFNSKK